MSQTDITPIKIKLTASLQGETSQRLVEVLNATDSLLTALATAQKNGQDVMLSSMASRYKTNLFHILLTYILPYTVMDEKNGTKTYSYFPADDEEENTVNRMVNRLIGAMGDESPLGANLDIMDTLKTAFHGNHAVLNSIEKIEDAVLNKSLPSIFKSILTAEETAILTQHFRQKIDLPTVVR